MCVYQHFLLGARIPRSPENASWPSNALRARVAAFAQAHWRSATGSSGTGYTLTGPPHCWHCQWHETVILIRLDTQHV